MLRGWGRIMLKEPWRVVSSMRLVMNPNLDPEVETRNKPRKKEPKKSYGSLKPMDKESNSHSHRGYE